MVGLAPETWERYLGRILVLILAWLVWSSGSWTRRYFVGKYPAERTRRRRLALYYGYPYQLMGLRLYHRVEIIEASEDVMETPADLPNPHEPIRSEETMDGVGSWSVSQSSRAYDSDDSDDEEHEITSPLRSDAVSTPATNGKSPINSPWLVRLLRLVPSKGN